jgi:hypothetical protein
MGECAYAFKLGFDSEAQAKKALPKVKRFIKQAEQAYNFWQKNRDRACSFWSAFEQAFPLITEYVKEVKDHEKKEIWGEDYHNGLSGHLDFGQDGKVKVIDNTIYYYADPVWHFMDWDDMVNFLQKKTKAIRAVWGSDEGTGTSYDSLNLYEYQEIVEAILTKATPDILLSLKGVHPHLDDLITYHAKRMVKRVSTRKK